MVAIYFFAMERIISGQWLVSFFMSGQLSAV
jgi:hypothetical protein